MLEDKDYFMKIKGIPKYFDIVMLIGLVLLCTKALLQDIVFYLEEILSLGKARNKMLLPDHLLKLSIGQLHRSLVSLYG